MQAHGTPPRSPLMSRELRDNCLPSLISHCGLIRGAVRDARTEIRNWKEWKTEIDDRYIESLHQLEKTQAKIDREQPYPGMGPRWIEQLKENVAVLRRESEAHKQASEQTSHVHPHLDQFEGVLNTFVKALADLTVFEAGVVASIQTSSQNSPCDIASLEGTVTARPNHCLTTVPGQPQNPTERVEAKLRICTCKPSAMCVFLPAPCPSFPTLRDVFTTSEERQPTTPTVNVPVPDPWRAVIGLVITGPMNELMRMSLTGSFLRSTVERLTMLQRLEFDLGQEDPELERTKTNELDGIILPHLRFIVTRFSYLTSRLDFMAGLDVPDIQQVTLLTFPQRVRHQSRGWEVLTDFVMFNDHLPSLQIRELHPRTEGECSVGPLSALLRNPVQLE